MDAWVSFKVVGIAAFSSHWTIVFVVQFLADLFFWLRTDNLAAKTMRKVTVVAILTVTCEIVDAWIKASIDVGFTTLLRTGAFLESKVLMATVRTDIL